jgi:hypothetical protein
MLIAMGLICRMIALLYINYNLFSCFDTLIRARRVNQGDFCKGAGEGRGGTGWRKGDLSDKVEPEASGKRGIGRPGDRRGWILLGGRSRGGGFGHFGAFSNEVGDQNDQNDKSGGKKRRIASKKESFFDEKTSKKERKAK